MLHGACNVFRTCMLFLFHMAFYIVLNSHVDLSVVIFSYSQVWNGRGTVIVGGGWKRPEV